MNIKQPGKQNRRPFTADEAVLLVLAVLLLLFGFFIFGWYGSTYISHIHNSEFHPKNLEISDGGQQCTLEIPAGKLSIRRPVRTVVGSKYSAEADVVLDQPLRFTNCTGGLPNWNISLEAQTAFVGSAVVPFAAIRQGAFNRENFSFQWSFTPEEPVAQYQSHFYLRAIVTKGESVIENWNMLVRDFPMENQLLLGQPIVLWFITGGFSAVTGILLLILLVQKRKKHINVQ